MKTHVGKWMVKIICLLLVLCGLQVFSEKNIANAYTTHTADEGIAWAASKVGQSLEGDNYYGDNNSCAYQCVDFIICYYKYLGVTPSTGNACDYATNALPSGWTRVKDGRPQKGDILVYSANDKNKNGHVAIYESDRSTYHQNFSGCRKVTHETYQYNDLDNDYWGYIRPNWSNVSVNNPEANIDAVEGGAGYVKVSGWGFDRDNLSTAIEIHVYIGGSAAEPQKAEGHVIHADKGRGDVDQAFSCGGYHGFEENIPTTKTGQQVVWIYAINIGNGENICLGSRTVNILPSPNPVGVLESVEGGAGFVKVNGWGFDRDDLSAGLDIQVYIGGSASPNVENHVIQADKSRIDVDKALSCGEHHGFDDVIFTDKTGTQEVYVYAINIGNGDNICLGSGTVNIASVSLGDVFQDGKVDGKD